MVVALAPSCAAIWGFEDATLGSTVDGGASSSSSSSSSGDSNGDSGDQPDGSSPIPEGCEQRVADTATGLFVDSFGGEDTETCGDADKPCKSIGPALSHADGKQQIYIGLGEYEESLAIPPSLLGRSFRLEGRWQRTDTGWKPFCVDDPSSASLVADGDSAAIRVERLDPEPSDAGSTDAGDAQADSSTPEADAGDTSDLVVAYLSVAGKRTPSPGESSYGVFARNTRITLLGVTVVGGRGGNGDTGETGAAGSGQSNGNGAPGPNGSAVPQGRFDPNGWQPSEAPPVELAGPGNPGPRDGALCAGGNGGGPGGPGQSGGATVAVFLWDAILQLEPRTGLATIGGGVGGNGGPGGLGAPGGQTAGVCSGGAGGAGGVGGPGPGGPSYCVVLGADSSLVGQPLGATNCAPSPGGAGGNNNTGIPGEKGPSLVVTP